MDTNTAGVRAEVLLMDNRGVTGIDSPSLKVHSTIANTGDVIESARTEEQVKTRVSPAVILPNGSWESATLVGAGTVLE